MGVNKFNILIVGLGIGQLYQKVLSELNVQQLFDIDTLDTDSSKNPTYSDVAQIPENKYYKCVIICTPTYTHKQVALELCSKTSLLVIEKPGFKTAADWIDIFNYCGDTKVVMVKNNLFRDVWNNLSVDKFTLNSLSKISFRWINKDRVSGPGTWITTKELSYGGVSRDLMCHVVNAAQKFFGTNLMKELSKATYTKNQKYVMSDITKTSYGNYNPNGKYNVDDRASLNFLVGKVNVDCTVAWKADVDKDYIEYVFEYRDGTKLTYDAGLCPENAYLNMLMYYMSLSEEEYKKQYDLDIALHVMFEKFDNLQYSEVDLGVC